MYYYYMFVQKWSIAKKRLPLISYFCHVDWFWSLSSLDKSFSSGITSIFSTDCVINCFLSFLPHYCSIESIILLGSPWCLSRSKRPTSSRCDTSEDNDATQNRRRNNVWCPCEHFFLLKMIIGGPRRRSPLRPSHDRHSFLTKGTSAIKSREQHPQVTHDP